MIVLHENTWWWGKSLTLITEKGRGMIDMQLEDDCPHVAFLKNLSVYVDSRRNGVATELMRICRDMANHYKCKYLRLEVEKSQTLLVDWNTRLGFDIIMEGEHYYDMMCDLRICKKW